MMLGYLSTFSCSRVCIRVGLYMHFCVGVRSRFYSISDLEYS